MIRLLAVVAALLTLAPGLVRADVLGPPPTNCPAGAKGRTSHSGPHCVPATCENGCEAGFACKPTDLCIAQRQGATRVGRYTFETVRGPCGANRTCAEGTCETREVCVPSAAAPVEPAGRDAAVEVAATPAQPSATPDAQVQEDKKLGTETRKPAACATGTSEGALALALPLALLAVVALRRRGQER
ncbi:MAG: hypothetical protein QM765_04930 [Myxococcales bacterium]